MTKQIIVVAADGKAARKRADEHFGAVAFRTFVRRVRDAFKCDSADEAVRKVRAAAEGLER